MTETEKPGKPLSETVCIVCISHTPHIILYCVRGYVLNLASTYGSCVNEVCSSNSQSIVKLHKREQGSAFWREETGLAITS